MMNKTKHMKKKKKKKGMGFGSQTISSIHPAIEISTP